VFSVAKSVLAVQWQVMFTLMLSFMMGNKNGNTNEMFLYSYLETFHNRIMLKQADEADDN
jgi:hypothetical protein